MYICIGYKEDTYPVLTRNTGKFFWDLSPSILQRCHIYQRKMNHFHFQSHSLHHQQYIETVDNIGKVMMIKLSPFFAPMMMMIVTVMMMMAKSPFFFLACPPYTETPLSLHLFHSHKLFCPLTQFGRTISLFLAPSSKLRGEFTLTILTKALSVPFLVSSFWDYLWSKIPIKRVLVTWIILGQILSALEQSEGLQNYDSQFSKALLCPATNPPFSHCKGKNPTAWEVWEFTAWLYLSYT